MILDDINIHDAHLEKLEVAGDTLTIVSRHWNYDKHRDPQSTYHPVTLVFHGVTDLVFKRPVPEDAPKNGFSHIGWKRVENLPLDEMSAAKRSWLARIEREHPEAYAAWCTDREDLLMETTTLDAFLEREHKSQTQGNGMNAGVADVFSPTNENVVQIDMHFDWRFQFRYGSVEINLDPKPLKSVH